MLASLDVDVKSKLMVLSDIDERLTRTWAAWPSVTSLTFKETSGAISLSTIVTTVSVPLFTPS